MYAVICKTKAIPRPKFSKENLPTVSSESVEYYKSRSKAWKVCHKKFDKALRKIYTKSTEKKWKYHKIKSVIGVWEDKITYYSTNPKCKFYWVKTFMVVDLGYFIKDKDLEEI